MKNYCVCVKTSNSFVVLLIFWIWLSQFVCLVGWICGVRAHFQPNSVASTKIRLSRISAENMVQPAEFFEKSGWGVYCVESSILTLHDRQPSVVECTLSICISCCVAKWQQELLFVGQKRSGHSRPSVGFMQSTFMRDAECRWVSWRRRGVERTSRLGHRQTVFITASCRQTENGSMRSSQLHLSHCYSTLLLTVFV